MVRRQQLRNRWAVRRRRRRDQWPDGISRAGVAFVAAFEGFRARPYRDMVGVWTIGYGETRGIGPHTRPWSRQHALTQLKRRLDTGYGSHVRRAARAAGMPLTQGQYDALTSLTYNLGVGILGDGRSLGDAIRSRSHRRVADAILEYDWAGGRRVPGLTRRRRAERRKFLRSRR